MNGNRNYNSSVLLINDLRDVLLTFYLRRKMQKIERNQLVMSAIAGGGSKGNNSASATASGDATATATVTVNQPAPTQSA
ncbi:hypothetical protein [Paraburkholderia diazotrophica]|uniref:hypothetical protein n=1 Tax=Paraburkholderia diazotrophica TaxID=667676 RepID=UPI00316BE4CC